MTPIKDTDYLAVSARLHAMENRLLTPEKQERLLEAANEAEARKLLAECGYAENSPLEEALRLRRESLFKDLSSSIPEPRLLDLFRIKFDYHNIKAILKAERRGISPEGLLLSGGRYDAERMQNEWHQEHRLTASDAARDAAEKAAALLRENDPQGADLVLDAACYAEMAALAAETKSGFLQGYVRQLIDAANLRTAVRAARSGSSEVLPTRVILVGDVDQLQSVGAGDVFRELIDSGLIPVTVLNEIFRQKKGSLIAYNAKRINEANIDLQYGEDFQFVKCQTQEEAADLICRIFCEQVALHGIEKVQILSPFRSEGPASVEQLNAAIRELVNPARDEFADLKVGSHYFRVGDKVMQTKNNAKASNGDIGYIRKMGRNAKNEMDVTIEFSGDRIAEYGMEEMSHMELAYATTVHKAMGSEFDIVIMPILRSHYIMLNRNIVYTAITRAKEQVIPVGQKKTLIMAILKKATGKRNTQLGERIGKYLKAFTRQNELKKVS